MADRRRRAVALDGQLSISIADVARIGPEGTCITQRHERRSLATMQIHVRLLLAHIGDLEPHQMHDATLAPFIASRVAAGASATTINRSLEVVRAVLNRAARSYRDADGTPWLTGIRPRALAQS